MGEREVQLRNGLYGFEYLEKDQRRAESGERKTYEIKQLWQRNHEIVNLSVRGFKNTEIAEILNITPETVSNTLNSELGMRKTAELRACRDDEAKKVSEKIRVITNKALATYNEVFDDEQGQLSLKERGVFASRFLEEMSGLKAPTKVQGVGINVNLTAEELASFRERGMQAMKDAKPKEVTE